MNPFSLIIGIGASFGLLRIIQKPPAGAHLRWLSAGLITLAGALIGARIGFAAAYDSYFKTHLSEIIQITKGGLSWPGALIGASLFAVLALRMLKLPFRSGLDQLSRMLLPIGLAVWLAAWQTGIAYGKPLPAGTWWGLNITDNSGLTALRVPVQPVAAIFLILFLGIGEWLGKKSRKRGVQAALIAGLFSVHALLFSLYRTDPVQYILGYRLDTWAAAAFFLLSLFSLIILSLRKKTTGKSTAVEMEKPHEIEPGTSTN